MIDCEDRGVVRVVALRRPPVNALNLALARAIRDALVAAAEDSSCRALVLTGSPGVFSAGIDTREVPTYDDATRSAMLHTVNETIRRLYTLPKPVVAAVSGHALGGALVLALACDVRLVAVGDFRLGLTEAAAGIPFPAGPLAVVEAELSPESIRRLALLAPTLSPDSPEMDSLFDAVVAPADLLDEATERAGRLAELPAFARVKAQLRAGCSERLRRIVELDEEPLHHGWI